MPFAPLKIAPSVPLIPGPPCTPTTVHPLHGCQVQQVECSLNAHTTICMPCQHATPLLEEFACTMAKRSCCERQAGRMWEMAQGRLWAHGCPHANAAAVYVVSAEHWVSR
jgi:hypothetical protein